MLRVLYSNRKLFIFTLLILVAFLQRGSTLFVEFYDVDELTDFIMTNEIFLGGKIYEDAIPGRPLYFAFFYISFLLFGPSYIGLHFLTIIWVILTAFVLYKISKLLFSERAGYIAFLFYSVFVSGFFEFYLAVHGEIIFNFFVAISLYFFVLAEHKTNRYTHYFLAGVLAALAFLTKGHTLVLFLYYPFYLLILRPLFLKERTFKLLVNNAFVSFYIGMGFSLGFFFILGLFYLADVSSAYVLHYITSNVIYSLKSISKIEFIPFLQKLFIQLTENTLSQIILWLLLLFYLIKRNKLILKQSKELFLFGLFIVSFMAIFLGGYRLYFHYFIQYLPILCLVSAFSMTLYIPDIKSNRRRVKLANYLIILPILIFSIWNYRNAFYLHYDLSGVFPINHSVTAKKGYSNLSKWIKLNTNENDRIVQWGNYIEIYHFSNRRPGIRSLWCSLYTRMYEASASKYTKEKLVFNKEKLEYKKSLSRDEQWTFNSKEDIQYSVILDLDKKKPKYIVDTAQIGVRNSNVIPLNKMPILFDYINKHYNFVNTIDRIKIYEIRQGS